MSEPWAMVLAAVIATVGTVLVTFIQISRKENKEDHALVVEQIRHLYKVMTNVDKKIDRHLTWHSEGEANDDPRRHSVRK